MLGVTTDGLPVIGGAFKLYDTHGLPLDVLRDMAREGGFMFAMDDFVVDAVRSGWKESKAWAVAREGC